MKILNVVGARPNFMKIAPLIRAIDRCSGLRQTLVHTGQHYDANLSDVFFADLGIPAPDVNLAVGAAPRDEQIRGIAAAFEPVLQQRRPDVVIVVGDVNSTIACGAVARKHGIALAHVEAGLRSFDRSMPEEINRIETDRISDYLFVTEQSAVLNLENECVEGRVFFVGNVMIDTLVHTLATARASNVHERLGIGCTDYAVATFHRPANVDAEAPLRELVETIVGICNRMQLVLPLHPRTRASLQRHGLLQTLTGIRNLHVTEPLGYVDFISLLRGAKAAITDSGGIQEETTYLGIPCLTMRDNTERPATVDCGTNTLVGFDRSRLFCELERIRDGSYPMGSIPPLWDGNAARRIVGILAQEFARIGA